jgi:hypothetical protein
MCDSCYAENTIDGTNLELNTGSSDKEIPVTFQLSGGLNTSESK